MAVIRFDIVSVPDLPPPSDRRGVRVAAALTQAELALLIGVSRPTLCRWESGRTEPRGTARTVYSEWLRIVEEAGTRHSLGAEEDGCRAPS